MSQAARLGDPIEHTGSLTGLLAGLAIGAIGAALIVGTGGLAAVAIVGASATAGAGIGQLIGSLSVCDHSTGQIQSGSANVFINGKPAARAHLDTALCDEHGPAPQLLAQGSDTVYINGVPAARVGDRTVCDAKISSGSGNVVIGGGTQTTDSIRPEVPEWLERSLLVVGLGSALVLASPIVVAAGLVGGIAGGAAGHWAGGKLFGAGSDGQKLMTFGAGLLGGGLGAKGGKWFDARYEIQTQGLGSNFGNVKVVNKTAPKSEKPRVPTPNRGSDGRFIKSSEAPLQFNRKSQYPSSYRAGIKDKVLDAYTITEGPDSGKIWTPDLDIVSRNDPRITIEHKTAVVEHWNEVGYNSPRSVRNDFFNDTKNMSIRLRSMNSAAGGKMAAAGDRYRQDVGPEYE